MEEGVSGDGHELEEGIMSSVHDRREGDRARAHWRARDCKKLAEGTCYKGISPRVAALGIIIHR